ncbi:unnamed protein product [Alopecurus aequalis]
MASRRFFDYDPYEYLYPSHSNYFHDFDYMDPAFNSYYRRRPASARAPARGDGADCFEIEVTGPDPEPKRSTARPCAPPANTAVPKKSAAPSAKEAAATVQAAAPKKSADEAAVMVQAAARGLLARRMMREVRAVERQAEVIAARVVAEAEALRANPRSRIGVGEELMRLVLRLDAVRGVREYRRRVTRKVLALQDTVDALEAMPAQAADTPAAAEPMAADDAVESEMAPELPQTGEQGVQIEDDIAADSSATAEMEMDVDAARAEDAATESIAAELVEEQTAEAEGEWEMVTGDDDDAFAGEPKVQEQEAAGEETEEEKKTEEKKTEAAAADGLDAKKVMDMVAALCERSAQQCELIGALVQRVDTLERALQRMEDAERRRQKIKKIKKEGKSNSKAA